MLVWRAPSSRNLRSWFSCCSTRRFARSSMRFTDWLWRLRLVSALTSVRCLSATISSGRFTSTTPMPKMRSRSIHFFHFFLFLFFYYAFVDDEFRNSVSVPFSSMFGFWENWRKEFDFQHYNRSQLLVCETQERGFMCKTIGLMWLWFMFFHSLSIKSLILLIGIFLCAILFP